MKENHSPTTEAPTSILARTMEAVVMRVCQQAHWVLLGGFILIIASVWFAGHSLQYRTSRDDLMSADKDYQRRWQSYLNEFGDDDDMVVVVEGSDRAQLHLALEATAAKIRQHPDRFDRLFYKVDLRALRDRALLYLTLPELQQVAKQVDTVGVLFGPLAPLAWQSMTVQSLLLQAAGCAEHLAQGQPLSATDTALWQQLPTLLQNIDATLHDPAQYRNPWQGLMPSSRSSDYSMDQVHYFENAKGTLAFLLVRPLKQSGSFTPAKEAVETLRGILAEVGEQHPQLAMGLTGLAVLENDEMSATEVDANRAALLALIGVTLLYLVVYRGFRYPLLTVLTLIIGTIWALGWLTLTVGHLNILSATFAVMLIGMGDYGVLWVARYDSERGEGRDADAAMRRTARIAGPSIITAAATTSLAFFATMLADFQAVKELGWIAGCGVILCAIACFTMLPAMMVVLEPYRRTGSDGPEPERRSRFLVPLRRPPSMETWLPALAHRPRLVLGSTGLLVFLAAGIAIIGLRYDHNLLNMQPKNLESVQWELKLIEQTTGTGFHALSIAQTPAEAIARKAEFERLPEVSRVVEIASLVPTEQDEKRSIMRRLQQRLKYLPEEGKPIAQPAPDYESIRRAARYLQQQIAALPLEQRGAERVIQRLNETLDDMRPSQVHERIRGFEQRMLQDLSNDLHQLRKVSYPGTITLADLPPDLRERHIGSNGQYLVRVFAAGSVWDFAPLEKFVQQVRTIDPEATGKPFGTLEGLRTMKAGFQWAGVYALLAIVLVLSIDFREVKQVALALLPLLIGVIVALGVLALCGVPMNPANLIALPLIVGVGVDNGVHVLHDYRERQRGKRYRLSAPTGKGIMVAALTTMLGFGTLMVGRHQGQSGLGLTLTLGVGCCMIAALVVLPALLRWLEDRDATDDADSPAVLRFPNRAAA